LGPWFGRGVEPIGRFGPYFVYVNPAALGRVRAATAYVVIPGRDRALDALARGTVDPGHTVILTRAPGRLAPAKGARPPAVVWKRLSPLAVTCRTAGDYAGLLLVDELYYPGWRATLDGRETPVYRANVISKAVVVPAGRHVVRFEYRPRSFRTGLAVTAAAAFGTLALFIALSLGRKRGPTA
jgi:hypothetical protein